MVTNKYVKKTNILYERKKGTQMLTEAKYG